MAFPSLLKKKSAREYVLRFLSMFRTHNGITLGRDVISRDKCVHSLCYSVGIKVSNNDLADNVMRE